MTTSSDFWNKMADKYAAQPVENQAAYDYKLAQMQERLRSEMQVLEFGCGTGTTALILAPFVRSIKAIDYSYKMIEIADKKAKKQSIENVHFETSSLDALTDPLASYDAILGMSILHLLPNRSEAMAKVFSLLKPGGRFYSSTTCINDNNHLIRLILPVMSFLGLAPFVAKFTSIELVKELKNTGFEIEMQWHPDPKSTLFIIAKKPD